MVNRNTKHVQSTSQNPKLRNESRTGDSKEVERNPQNAKHRIKNTDSADYTNPGAKYGGAFSFG